MSKFSGKCDFCDHLWISAKTDDEAFNKFNGTKLYISQPLPDGFDFKKALEDKVNIPETYYKKVKYSSIRDLVPLYPYLISMSYCDNTDSHNSVVILSSESFVDREEQEHLEYYLKDLLRVYNRCKRKKIEFNVEEAVKEVYWGKWYKDIMLELANRVKEKGKKASIDGIHLPTQEHYRQELTREIFKYDCEILLGED